MARKKTEDELVVDLPSDYEAFVPPPKKDEQEVSVLDALSSLWKEEEPKQEVPPIVQVQTIYIEPPKQELPHGPTMMWGELGIFHKKAQWVGAQPTPDTPCVEVPCEMCQKPTWTRRVEESVCEMCYRLEIDKLSDLRMQAAPQTGERYFNPLR